MSMEGHGISWWEPLFEGMFYMHGICLDMLTPMLYIFVWPKRWGAIRDKQFGLRVVLRVVEVRVAVGGLIRLPLHRQGFKQS